MTKNPFMQHDKQLKVPNKTVFAFQTGTDKHAVNNANDKIYF